MHVDDIAPPSSGNTWKPEVGESIAGIITYADTFTGDDFDKKRRQRTLRLDIEDAAGDTWTIYAVTNADLDGDGYPKRDARAISDAVRAAGCATLEVGGRFGMRREADIPADKPGLSPTKTWSAQYQPPAAGVGADLLGGQPAAPAQQAATPAAPTPAAEAPPAAVPAPAPAPAPATATDLLG